MRTISIQLYSLRDLTSGDMAGVLKRLAAAGFKAVEPAGFGNLEIDEFKKICDDLGLAIPSSHSPWANLENLGEAMEIAHKLGLKSLACGYGPQDFETLDKIKATAEKTNSIIEKLKDNGFGAFQHNHAFEFERLDGALKYDLYLKMVPEIKLELDTYWCSNFGEEDAAEMVKHLSGRIVLAHIKDGSFIKNAPNVVLGEGRMDIPGVISALPETARTLVIEFDTCATDVFKAVEASRNYLARLGLGE